MRQRQGTSGVERELRRVDGSVPDPAPAATRPRLPRTCALVVLLVLVLLVLAAWSISTAARSAVLRTVFPRVQLVAQPGSAAAGTSAVAPSSPWIPGVEVVLWRRALPPLVLPSGYRPAGRGRPAILLCHGNGGYWAYHVDRMRQLASLFGPGDVDVYTYDYPGYGRSAGSPEVDTFHQTGIEVYERLAAMYGDGSRLLLVGESLGVVAALRIANSAAGAQRPPAGVVLINGFSTLSEVASSALGPFAAALAASALRAGPAGGMDNLNEALRLGTRRQQLPAVVVFASASDDRVVPPEHSRSLAEQCQAGGLCRHVRLVGDHNAWLDASGDLAETVRERTGLFAD